MNEIYLLTQDERELFFQTAADIQKMPFEIIEKDLYLFTGYGGGRGTSPSPCACPSPKNRCIHEVKQATAR